MRFLDGFQGFLKIHREGVQFDNDSIDRLLDGFRLPGRHRHKYSRTGSNNLNARQRLSLDWSMPTGTKHALSICIKYRNQEPNTNGKCAAPKDTHTVMAE